MELQEQEIKLVDVESLVPYLRNARTHSDEQVAGIAASVREFGFNSPVIIDANNNLVAGHGRLTAALFLGINSVPFKLLSDLPKSVIRNGIKDRICQDCGAEFTVRKDTNPIVCRRCVTVRGGRSILGKKRAITKPCKNCLKPINYSKKDVFCSIECRNAKLKEERTCKYCSKKFVVLKSSISLVTNASGNFCSRGCYEKWLCKTDRVTGRGSLWHRVRSESTSRHPFCAICGTTKNLHVHHIVPFRLTHDNSQENLIPLCPKHHKIVETMTHEIEHSGSDTNTMKLVLGSILRERSMATRTVLIRIRNEHRTLAG